MTNTTNYTALHVGNNHITIAMSTVSIAAVVLGLPGNILIIHTVRSRKQMQNARNYFILSLACADIVVLLICVPFYTLNFAHILHYMPEAVCKTLLPTGNVLVIVSVCTHVAIALERRRAIVFPLLPKPSPRRIKTLIATVWVVPVIVMGPTSYYLSQVSSGSFCHFRKDIGETYWKAFFVTFVIINFIIPVSVLIWSYRQIVRALKQYIAPIEELAETNAAVVLRLKNQRKVVNCLIILVCAFIALTFPFYSALVLSVFMITGDLYFSLTFNVVTLCVHFMLYSLNPIILYASSTEYRLAFNESFKLWKHFFLRVFSCFKKSKLLNGDHSKTSLSVIALSIINKECELEIDSSRKVCHY